MTTPTREALRTLAERSVLCADRIVMNAIDRRLGAGAWELAKVLPRMSCEEYAGVRRYYLDGAPLVELRGPHLDSDDDGRHLRVIVTSRFLPNPAAPE